jgi:polar amino acid transport system permease protein
MAAPAAATAAAPRRWRRLGWLTLGALVVAVAYVLVAFVIDWPDWVEPIARYILTEGLPATLQISAVAVVGSCLIGVALGTLLTIQFALSKGAIRSYVEVFRGLPILVTVFIVYFGLPALTPTLKFDPLWATSIALILWGSAQVAEATRGAAESIPREQHEASAALGFGWTGRHVYVIVPQALRRLLPPMVSLLVNVLQNSTLAALIGALELLESGKRQVERLAAPPPVGDGEIHALPIYGTLLLLFFLISFPLTRLAAFLEKRLI